MKKSTVVLIFDKSNKQEDFQYIAEDFSGTSHIGYVYIQKPCTRLKARGTIILEKKIIKDVAYAEVRNHPDLRILGLWE